MGPAGTAKVLETRMDAGFEIFNMVLWMHSWMNQLDLRINLSSCALAGWTSKGMVALFFLAVATRQQVLSGAGAIDA